MNEHKKEELALIPIDKIISKNSIRYKYSKKNLHELIESIKSFGQINPILVYECDDKYHIILGHRRCFATMKAGFKFVKAIITQKPTTTEEILIQLIDNEHSKTYDTEDRNKYIKKVLEDGETIENFAKKIGKSELWIKMCYDELKRKEEKQVLHGNSNENSNIEEKINLENYTEEEILNVARELCKTPNVKIETLMDLKLPKRKDKN